VKPIIPINYDLQFEPNFKNFTFRVKESLTINSFGYSNTIILNAAQLKIKNCTVEIANKTLKANVKLDAKKRSNTNQTASKNKGQSHYPF